jgi:hypothetical protein
MAYIQTSKTGWKSKKAMPGFSATKGLVVDISKSKAMKKAKCSSMARSSGNWSIVTMHGLAANTK